MKEEAIILTSGLFDSHNAKTAFGLIRNSEQYEILAVIDQNFAGQDAGKLVDGRVLDIPIHVTINEFLRARSSRNKLALEKADVVYTQLLGLQLKAG